MAGLTRAERLPLSTAIDRFFHFAYPMPSLTGRYRKTTKKPGTTAGKLLRAVILGLNLFKESLTLKWSTTRIINIKEPMLKLGSLGDGERHTRTNNSTSCKSQEPGLAIEGIWRPNELPAGNSPGNGHLTE